MFLTAILKALWNRDEEKRKWNGTSIGNRI